MDSTKSSPRSVTDAAVLRMANGTVKKFFTPDTPASSSIEAERKTCTPKLSPTCWKRNNLTPKWKSKDDKKKALQNQYKRMTDMKPSQLRKTLLHKKTSKSYPPLSKDTLSKDTSSIPYPKKGGRKTRRKRRRKHKLQTRKKRKSHRKSRKKHRKKHRKKRSTRKR